MATAVKEQQLVVAPSAMSNEHFRLHMNGRHEGEIGPENFTPDVAEPYRAFHRRLHDLRTGLDHHHEPETPEAAVEFALLCIQENRLRGWRQIAGTKGVVAFGEDGSFAIRFGTGRVHYFNQIGKVAEILINGKYPRGGDNGISERQRRTG
jgi:hypothetical protein